MYSNYKKIVRPELTAIFQTDDDTTQQDSIIDCEIMPYLESPYRELDGMLFVHDEGSGGRFAALFKCNMRFDYVFWFGILQHYQSETFFGIRCDALSESSFHSYDPDGEVLLRPVGISLRIFIIRREVKINIREKRMYVNVFGEWRDGGYKLTNPNIQDAPLPGMEDFFLFATELDE